MEQDSYPAAPILIVDDEKNALKSYELAFLSAGINNILTCENGMHALEYLSSKEIELILLDVIMPNISGTELLRQIVNDYPEVPVIMVTGVNNLSNAVECMQLGAIDYMLKPVDPERLIAKVKSTIELRKLKRDNYLLQKHLLLEEPANTDRPEAFALINTQDKNMISLFQYCKAIAQSRQPVLITGETGVGKELFTQALHKLSGCPGELVTVNIAGLDDNILSDTLFGHHKGAFTGALNNRPGMIEKANNGTLFIDEIGDLNIASQVKLLRLLQEREYSPLGSDTAKISTARVILATHRDLHELQRDAKFRKDLYYRISTHHVAIPPLRDRKEDIQLLLNFMITQISSELNKKPPQYPPELVTLLKAYHFPGNIRELEAMVYDAISNHKSKMLSTKFFIDHISRNSGNSKLNEDLQKNYQSLNNCFSDIYALPTLKESVKILIQEALRRSEGNQSIAARMLGITPQALSARLKK